MDNQIELAWCAGFYDGEGSTGFYNGSLRMECSQVHDQQVLERFINAIERGSLYGPYPNRMSKPRYSWCATGKAAIESAELLWPYLGQVKREQITKALGGYKRLKFPHLVA